MPADQTTLQEAAQALFCSIADLLGTNETNILFDLKKYETYDDFELKNKKIIAAAAARIVTPSVSLKDIEKFLREDKKNTWYNSSVIIAKELLKEISTIDSDFKIKAPGFQNIFYFRGDDGVMGNIQELFNIANKAPITIKNQLQFGNINKWNPADIYFATEIAKKKLIDELKKAKPLSYSFLNLNELTSSLIESGNLLPLSLKKAKNTVKIERVNFDRKKELDIIRDIKILSVNDWKPYKIVKHPAKGETRDITVNLSNGGTIKMRHEPSTPSYKIEAVIDRGSRGGSIGSMEIFCDLLRLIDPATANKLLATFKQANIEFKKQLKKLQEKKFQADIYEYKRSALSALTITNQINPILKKWWNQKNNDTTQFIILVYQYATSRTPLSGKFVIAK
jgi:hypothetical protein